MCLQSSELICFSEGPQAIMACIANDPDVRVFMYGEVLELNKFLFATFFFSVSHAGWHSAVQMN